MNVPMDSHVFADGFYPLCFYFKIFWLSACLFHHRWNNSSLCCLLFGWQIASTPTKALIFADSAGFFKMILFFSLSKLCWTFDRGIILLLRRCMTFGCSTRRIFHWILEAVVYLKPAIVALERTNHLTCSFSIRRWFVWFSPMFRLIFVDGLFWFSSMFIGLRNLWSMWLPLLQLLIELVVRYCSGSGFRCCS